MKGEKAGGEKKKKPRKVLKNHGNNRPTKK